MRWKKRELAELEPNSEILWCPVCGEIVWQHKTEPISVRMSIPSRSDRGSDALMLMHEAANELYLQTVVLPAEEASRIHFKDRHRLRFWLWDRLGWDRLLRRWLFW